MNHRKACISGIVSALLTLVVGCWEPDENAYYTAYAYRDSFGYDVQPDAETPGGIPVDTDGQSIDLASIDTQLDVIDACLARNFPSGKRVGVAAAADCRADFSPRVDRGALTVLVTSDWSYSCDGSQMVLNVLAPQSGCTAKGLTPNPDCPCRWRTGFQDEPSPTVVVPPSLYMFPDSVVRYTTGCLDPWADAKLAECARPSVPPLPVEQTE